MDEVAQDGLKEEARTLMKGCQQHYLDGVMRVKKIVSAAHPGFGLVFENMAKSLLNAATLDELDKQAAMLLRDFAISEGWLEWWMRPRNKSMLFAVATKMTEEMWRSLPLSNNPSEGINFKFSAAAGGKGHNFQAGLSILYNIATHYHKMHIAVCSSYFKSNLHFFTNYFGCTQVGNLYDMARPNHGKGQNK